nr:GGDEF domain-containing protein [Rheinheimera maricola]
MWASAAVAADAAFLLAEADRLKSADRERFGILMSQLRDIEQSFTAEENSFYRYLDAYSVTLSGDFTSAVTLFEQLIKDSSTSHAAFRAKVTLVNIYTVSRRYNKAFEISEEIIRNADQLNDTKVKEQAFRVLALLYNTVGDYSSGYFFADEIVQKTSNATSRCAAWQLKIEAMYYVDHSEGFYSQYEQALSSCKEAGEKLFEAIIVIYRARQLIDISLNHDALTLLLDYLEVASSTQYPQVMSAFNALIAKAYFYKDDFLNAEKFALLALDAGVKTEFSEPLTWAYEVLYLTNKKMAKFQVALDYHEKFLQFDKAYLDNLSAGQLAMNMARSATQVKSQQIALLNKDNDLLLLQKNVYEQEVKQNRLAMMLLFSVLTIASFIAYRAVTGRRRFKKIAEYDQLTGISNRYHFNNQAKIALDYCESNAKPVALILFDLDFFKSINDTYGHAAGDWTLQAVVKTCRNFMRNNDVFGRIGGEEFAVVLPGCQVDKAVLLAEICRDAIATIDTSESGYIFPLSASFGVSSSDTSGYQLKQLLADADNAMYQSKQAGRDRVSEFSH